MKTWTVGDLVAVPLPNGVRGLIWVLHVMGGAEHYVRFLVMAGFWPTCPTEHDANAAEPAKPIGAPMPEDDDVWKGSLFGPPAIDFQVVGRRDLTAVESGYVTNSTGTMVFGTSKGLRDELYGTWRFQYDRPALEAEWKAARLAREARAEERRKARTLPTMFKERIFTDWSAMWPRSVVQEARRIFKDATKELIDLQATGTEAQRVAVLKRIVTEFNALDDKAGCVETGEREEIVERVEQLAALVGLNNEDERLTGHRDW